MLHTTESATQTDLFVPVDPITQEDKDLRIRALREQVNQLLNRKRAVKSVVVEPSAHAKLDLHLKHFGMNLTQTILNVLADHRAVAQDLSRWIRLFKIQCEEKFKSRHAVYFDAEDSLNIHKISTGIHSKALAASMLWEAIGEREYRRVLAVPAQNSFALFWRVRDLWYDSRHLEIWWGKLVVDICGGQQMNLQIKLDEAGMPCDKMIKFVREHSHLVRQLGR